MGILLVAPNMVSINLDSQRFYIEGRRLELRSWRQLGDDGRRDQLRVERSSEQRQLVERLARGRRERAQLVAALADIRSAAERVDRMDVLVDAVMDELSRGRLSLWFDVPPYDFALVAEPSPDLLDSLGECTEPSANDTEDEPPLHVLVKIAYDPDRPEAWDDTLRLFSTDDEGGTYDQAVDLASEAQTQRDDQELLVLFKDVVPDREYSCFLDLGGEDGGYLVFHQHRVGTSHRVAGLPRDVAC